MIVRGEGWMELTHSCSLDDEPPELSAELSFPATVLKLFKAEVHFLHPRQLFADICSSAVTKFKLMLCLWTLLKPPQQL